MRISCIVSNALPVLLYFLLQAINRLQLRNKLTESEARLRLSSQPHNSDYIDQSHVVFCSAWDVAYTRKQVDRAYCELLNRVHGDTTLPNQDKL